MVAVVIGLGVLLAVEFGIAALVLGMLVLVNSVALRLHGEPHRPSVHGGDFFRSRSTTG